MTMFTTVPTAAFWPGCTPRLRENIGPLIDMGCELEAGGRVYISERELADMIATEGVLGWPRLVAVLDAAGWAHPSVLKEERAAMDARVEQAEAGLAEALANLAAVTQTLTLVNRDEQVPDEPVVRPERNARERVKGGAV